MWEFVLLICLCLRGIVSQNEFILTDCERSKVIAVSYFRFRSKRPTAYPISERPTQTLFTMRRSSDDWLLTTRDGETFKKGDSDWPKVKKCDASNCGAVMKFVSSGPRSCFWMHREDQSGQCLSIRRYSESEYYLKDVDSDGGDDCTRFSFMSVNEYLKITKDKYLLLSCDKLRMISIRNVNGYQLAGAYVFSKYTIPVFFTVTKLARKWLMTTIRNETFQDRSRSRLKWMQVKRCVDQYFCVNVLNDFYLGSSECFRINLELNEGKCVAIKLHPGITGIHGSYAKNEFLSDAGHERNCGRFVFMTVAEYFSIATANTFTFVNKRMDFPDGMAECKGLGGKVAVIHNKNEQSIASWVSHSADHPGCYRVHFDQYACWAFIAYKRILPKSKTFKWIGGNSNYTNFHRREPNNGGGDEKCVMVNFNYLKWNDVKCDMRLSILCDLSVPGIPECGGKKEVGTSKGFIVSHSEYGKRNYGNSMYCEWNIEGASNKTIRLHVTSFNVEFSPDCEHDSLTIFDGPDANSPVLRRLCGRKGLNLFFSSGKSVTLRFLTNQAVPDKGFRIDYKMVDEIDPSFIPPMDLPPMASLWFEDSLEPTMISLIGFGFVLFVAVFILGVIFLWLHREWIASSIPALHWLSAGKRGDDVIKACPQPITDEKETGRNYKQLLNTEEDGDAE